MANYKRLFLTGHSYYFTIVTHQREAILINNIKILRESFQESMHHYHYSIDSIVILPDHIHMIMTPKYVNEYPKIIHAIKYNFSKRYQHNEIVQSSSRYKRQMKPIWQKRYYEHTIRDEKDYLRCIEYIRNNPIKHQYIENREVWKYLSVP